LQTKIKGRPEKRTRPGGTGVALDCGQERTPQG
jgi:hypothetical protein